MMRSVCIKNVCVLINIEGDFLMKKIVFLALLFSSFLAVACGDNSTQSVGGSVADRQGSVQANSGLSASFSGSVVGTDCVDLPPITVTGFVYFSIPRLVVGITYVLNSGGGGGGDTTVEANSTLGCDGAGDAKLLFANKVFQAAKASAGVMGMQAFLQKYKAGTTFNVLYPDGTTGKWVVSNPQFTHPFTHERSCG